MLAIQFLWWRSHLKTGLCPGQEVLKGVDFVRIYKVFWKYLEKTILRRVDFYKDTSFPGDNEKVNYALWTHKIEGWWNRLFLFFESHTKSGSNEQWEVSTYGFLVSKNKKYKITTLKNEKNNLYLFFSLFFFVTLTSFSVHAILPMGRHQIINARKKMLQITAKFCGWPWIETRKKIQ
jgi:hypothetical protein